MIRLVITKFRTVEIFLFLNDTLNNGDKLMIRAALMASIVLTACTPTVITEYNGTSIRIQSLSSRVTPEVLSEAQRVCGTQGLQAEFASTASRANDIFTHFHLFLCLTRAKPNSGLPRSIVRTPNYLETTSTL
jgi:hypothetical protein